MFVKIRFEWQIVGDKMLIDVNIVDTVNGQGYVAGN